MDDIRKSIIEKRARQLAIGWELIDGKQVYDETGEYVYKVAYDEAGRLIEKLEGLS